MPLKDKNYVLFFKYSSQPLNQFLSHFSAVLINTTIRSANRQLNEFKNDSLGVGNISCVDLKAMQFKNSKEF